MASMSRVKKGKYWRSDSTLPLPPPPPPWVALAAGGEGSRMIALTTASNAFPIETDARKKAITSDCHIRVDERLVRAYPRARDAREDGTGGPR